jgi:hypothetical protein
MCGSFHTLTVPCRSPIPQMYLAARPNNDKLSVSLEATAAKDLQSHQGGVLHVGQVWDQVRLWLQGPSFPVPASFTC